MRLIRLSVVGLVSLVAAVALLIVTFFKVASAEPPNTAIDITRLLLSPMFFVGFAAILVVAALLCWRWAIR